MAILVRDLLAAGFRCPKARSTPPYLVQQPCRQAIPATATTALLIDTVVDPLEMAQAGPGMTVWSSSREAQAGMHLNGQVKAGLKRCGSTLDGTNYHRFRRWVRATVG